MLHKRMMRFLTAMAALIGFASWAAPAAAVDFSFSGLCIDCAGTGKGTLVLKDYTLGDTLTAANFVSFTYDSSLLSYSLTSVDDLTGSLAASGPAYVASKHGVVGLTKAAALEYGRHGIRVNAVCPGPIRTPMMERIMAMSGNQAAEERFIKGEPLRRFGQPSEIGEAVAWLCSDHASYVTGIPMPVDGGAIAQ